MYNGFLDDLKLVSQRCLIITDDNDYEKVRKVALQIRRADCELFRKINAINELQKVIMRQAEIIDKYASVKK